MYKNKKKTRKTNKKDKEPIYEVSSSSKRITSK